MNLSIVVSSIYRLTPLPNTKFKSFLSVTGTPAARPLDRAADLAPLVDRPWAASGPFPQLSSDRGTWRLSGGIARRIAFLRNILPRTP